MSSDQPLDSREADALRSDPALNAESVSPPEALDGAFRAVVADDSVSMAHLRAVVLRCTDDARAANVPVERVIIRIKRSASKAGIRVDERVFQDDSIANEILAQSVRWCIERYYGT